MLLTPSKRFRVTTRIGPRGPHTETRNIERVDHPDLERIRGQAVELRID